MAVYIGGNKYKLIYKGNVCKTQIDTYIPAPVTKNFMLLSLDNCVLKDANNTYLTVAEYTRLLSVDDYILTDIDNKYIAAQKG